MPEKTMQLTLTNAQQSQFFAHLLTYLFSQVSNPTMPRNKATFDLVQEVSYRLFYLHKQECREMPFSLSSEEVQAVKDAFATLQHQYTQWAYLETSTVARDDLAACFLLLEKAEQQANASTESR